MPLLEPVTVLMPVRDGAQTVGLAISDLVSGLEPEDELLVVDDGSEDSTPEILNQVAREDRRLRVIRTSGVGLVKALNLGLAEARHRWIARADADDRYPSHRLSSQRSARGEGVVLVTGDYSVWGDGHSVGHIPCALTSPFVALSLLHPQRVPHPGVLLDREAVWAADGYRPEDFPAEDLALWLRLSSVGDLVGVPTEVVRWTMSRGSVSHSRQELQRKVTRELIEQSFPLARLRHLSVVDVEAELAAYEETAWAKDRRLLLARDLFALSRRTGDRALNRTAFKALARRPLGAVGSAVRLAAGQRRRQRIRHAVTQ